ncbi:hypothetical protein KA025_03340 [Candidatus Saccharibacteria bacterium]|nr:hypothetical protein [Candidatus Saccharibacteria bacterium]
MINLLIAITGIAFFLLLGEYLWQKKVLKGEYARKFVHITSATFVATWPIFLSQIEIAIISFLFIIALVITKKTKLFRSLRSIRRATYGEIWYALGIGASAILFSDGAVFAVAVLTMALADGFAAVVGVSMKKNAGKFKINGHQKSFAGTLTFILISFFINFIYWFMYASGNLPPSLDNIVFISMLSFGSASILGLAELLSPKGSDNIIVPVMAGLLVTLPVLI